METNWWEVGSSIAVAVGTLALGTITWFTLRHTIKRYRDKQLDDIAEWAMDIKKHHIVEENISTPDKAKLWKEENDAWEYRRTSLLVLLNKKDSIISTARVFKQKSLVDAIYNLIDETDKHLHLITGVIVAIPPNRNLAIDDVEAIKEWVEANNKTADHMDILKKAVSNVLDEIYKIK